MLNGNRKGEVTDFNDKGCGKFAALTLLGLILIAGAGIGAWTTWL